MCQFLYVKSLFNVCLDLFPSSIKVVRRLIIITCFEKQKVHERHKLLLIYLICLV